MIFKHVTNVFFIGMAFNAFETCKYIFFIGVALNYFVTCQ